MEANALEASGAEKQLPAASPFRGTPTTGVGAVNMGFGGGGSRVLDIVYGRSRMALRTPTMPGQTTPIFY